MSSLPSFQTFSTASHLGQLLKTTRKRHKITQATLAGYVGVSQNRLSHLENHPEELSVKQLLSWCAALELELKLGERDTSSASSSAEW